HGMQGPSEPVLRNDGSAVISPASGQPIVMPPGVSLDENMEFGKYLGTLPDLFKLNAMRDFFWPRAAMDYKRPPGFSTTDPRFEAHRDFGNYNFGAVAAAAGLSFETALAGAGLFHAGNSAWNSAFGNQNPLNTSGAWGNDPRDLDFITRGYRD